MQDEEVEVAVEVDIRDGESVGLRAEVALADGREVDAAGRGLVGEPAGAVVDEELVVALSGAGHVEVQVGVAVDVEEHGGG